MAEHDASLKREAVVHVTASLTHCTHAELRKLEKTRMTEHDAFLKHEAALRSAAEKSLEAHTTENERLRMELIQVCLV